MKVRADYLLIYPFDIPRGHGSLDRWTRYGQKKRAMKYFGELPPSAVKKCYAVVMITRVQGPRQKALDGDNLQIGTKGARDALKACGYIVDDNKRWSTFVYQEDSTRRQLGPRIEVLVRYQENTDAN